MPHASRLSAHTPGPWLADLVDLIVYASGDTASKVAVIHQQIEPSEDSDVTSCNARLIAAAPALADQLQEFIEIARAVTGNWENGNLAHAVRNLLCVANEAETLLASIQ